MAGDWATGTREAEAVIESMAPRESPPDYTIHMGDVYYVGDEASIQETCLGKASPNNGFTPVAWRRGRLGSFALNGNHEMYASGEAYFSTFLPTLGIVENGTPAGQRVSYFCLENKHWRVIGLDTGYYSRGLPFLWILAGIFPFLLPGCKLHDDILKWLRNEVRLQDDRDRGLILLTHHQYCSEFEEHYTKAAKQLAEFIGRPVLWFWGHEHRLAIYHLQGSEKIQAHGRCIGHGGMPVQRRDPRNPEQLIYFDNRVYAEDDNFGWNGYVTLEFDGPQLCVRYFDIGSIRGGSNNLLFQENWTVSGQGQLSVKIEQKAV
jgi:hypothetical protein